MRDRPSSSRTLFIGNISGEVSVDELEEKFLRYGKVLNVRIKTPDRPPHFGFVDFEDVRDAQDAKHALNGDDFKGHKLRVEFTHEKRREAKQDEEYRHGQFHKIPSGPTVLVQKLDDAVSWQDLKDFFRKVGIAVLRTTVDRRGGGYVIVYS